MELNAVLSKKKNKAKVKMTKTGNIKKNLLTHDSI